MSIDMKCGRGVCGRGVLCQTAGRKEAKDPSDVLAMNHLFAASTLRNRYRLASDVKLRHPNNQVARQAEADCLGREMDKSYLTRYNHDRMRR